ncbi:MAG: hypothetical protein WC734_03015 [Patescibacteria group bacterium]|jgi:hypothetical protein
MLNEIHAGLTAGHPGIIDINECSFRRVETALREQTPEAFAAALGGGFFRTGRSGVGELDDATTQSMRMMLAAMVANLSMGARSNRPCP